MCSLQWPVSQSPQPRRNLQSGSGCVRSSSAAVWGPDDFLEPASGSVRCRTGRCCSWSRNRPTRPPAKSAFGTSPSQRHQSLHELGDQLGEVCILGKPSRHASILDFKPMRGLQQQRSALSTQLCADLPALDPAFSILWSLGAVSV